jgi:hypothetical protein
MDTLWNEAKAEERKNEVASLREGQAPAYDPHAPKQPRR